MNLLECIISKIFTIKGAIIYVIFFLCGVYLNHRVEFEAFYIFVLPFSAIFWISSAALSTFYKDIKKIIGLTVKQPPTEKAKVQLQKNLRSKLNYIVPLFVVFIFSIGGCTLYTSLKLSITFFWSMILFIVTVFLSICGYLHFVFFEYYIFQIANSQKKYKNLPVIKSINCPPEINWFNFIKKLVLLYQLAFFSVGSLFIFCFAAFCKIDSFGVTNKSNIYFLLWLIIIFAIIIAFPIMVILENKYINKIKINIQNYYFLLSKKEKISLEYDSTFNILFFDYIRNIIIKNIVLQDNTSLKSYISKGYAIITALFNIIVSLFSLLDIFNII